MSGIWFDRGILTTIDSVYNYIYVDGPPPDPMGVRDLWSD
jgi:hypothetical protein